MISKSLKVHIVVTRVESSKTFRIDGRVIFQNSIQEFAPSILAASYISEDTDCSPDRTDIPINGVPHQTLTNITEKNAITGVDSHAILWSVKPRP